MSLTVRIAGFGFSSSAQCSSFHSLYEKACQKEDVSMIAVLKDKADHDGFSAFCDDVGLEVVRVEPEKLTETDTPSRSEKSLTARGVGSVSEALALYVASDLSTGKSYKMSGAEVVLEQHRMISDDRLASMAVARLSVIRS